MPPVWMMISLSDQEFFLETFYTFLYFYKYAQVGISFSLYSYSQLLCLTVFFPPSSTFCPPWKSRPQALNPKEPHMCLIRDISNCWAPKVETAITKVSALYIRS